MIDYKKGQGPELLEHEPFVLGTLIAFGSLITLAENLDSYFPHNLSL